MGAGQLESLPEVIGLHRGLFGGLPSSLKERPWTCCWRSKLMGFLNDVVAAGIVGNEGAGVAADQVVEVTK